jgi:RNA polymerase sigma-70 factor (ECF subfamily)
MTEEILIKGCKAGDPAAQKALYEHWGPLLMGVVRRYLSRAEDAEDVFADGMFKILTKIQMFREEGSFEGWMKRIMVNEALMFLRKRHNFHLVREVESHELVEPAHIEHDLQVNEILKLLDELPDGYRTIFNMYVIEGYKHREIADVLGISINTSKSQLIQAKKRMQELLKKNRLTKAG